MRSKQLLRSVIFGAVLALGAASGGVARAEADTFGVGDGHNGAKTVAGNQVVNSYAPLTADVTAGATQITIGAVRGDAAGFAAGDLVMVWRAAGVATTQVGQRFTDRLQLSSATVGDGAVGTYELARVQSADTTTITFTKPLTRGFKKDVSQAVRIPEYTTLDVPANQSIVAAPWAASGAGYSGGIAVVFANGAVTLTGKIDADAAGFRGGEKVQRTALNPSCAAEDGAPLDGFADKGEGVVLTEYGPTKGGRGNWSFAAGGGNCQETGGGGGGNFGSGGTGGDSYLTNGSGGRGGIGIDYSLLERITMGGGGGAGEQKNGVGSGGGNGGGVILLRVKSLTGTGTFTAAGAAALNAGPFGIGAESDGAGGGGAGGSIVVRVADNAECGGLIAKGGKGGDTAVVTLGVFGSGGGGGGGRVLIQGKTVGNTCTANIDPGAAGSSGTPPRGQTAGSAGTTQPAPNGPFCFSNPANAADAQCADPKPVCDVAKGECNACNGGFGTNNTFQCPVAGEPFCAPDGSCTACQRDFSVPGDAACQVTATPYCETTGPAQGQCGKCDDDADCVGPTHPGPKCNVPAGACGVPCTNDKDCKGTEWCSQQVCIPKTPNSQPVSNLPPDTNGQCTPPVGGRTCLSGVCEEDDDLCGLKNGSPCNGIDERCRSNECFPKDELCGLPTGEPCTNNNKCRSNDCKAGLCAGCQEDTDCPTDKVCDKAAGQCVPGCRPGAQAPDGGADSGAARGLCPPGQECKPRDGGEIGDCVPSADAGTDGGAGDAGDLYAAGLVEGGGCSCRTTIVAASPPFAIFAAAAAGILAVRRRRTKR